ncbi:alpha-amylase family glycosyl hydrolase [Granulicella sp. L46]|uniref:alpha-amylase family glycosyl hydrolase n=1 Tax=Granulicella sp. L46 TaxID=1641865 RepID=UPI00131ECDFB|nr:alpha-amylase family glycosyl hydrolase [Granulicella sp. L46]
MSMADSEFEAAQWWQTGVIYQVYPRSFQDTNGDGVGDLKGITARLDYLKGLGVDAVWISPIFPSPMADFGYDVSDYTGVDPLFGTMKDFDVLLAAAHAKGLRVILDFVPNHTSDQHPWFVESRSSRTNAKRDWYLWHDAARAGDNWQPAPTRLPNNWMSQFGGPAWTWDEGTQQFYLHSFLKEQPDLNWRNPEVRAAMYAAMRFWLDKGVDGFRMDVLWLLIKDIYFQSNPPNPEYYDAQHDVKRVLPVFNADQPETLEIVAEMRALMAAYRPTIGDKGVGSSRVLIGEIYLPLDRLVRYYGAGPQLSGADLPFNFALIQTRWAADAIAEVITKYEGLLPAGAWPNYVLGNHDQPRLATRIGKQQARAAALLLLTLRGTPTMYYGDELGMVDAVIAPDQVRDPAEKNEPGKGRGRDPERSPMVWVSAPNAGFTMPDAVPWLPLEAGWETENAAEQGGRKESMLMLYRKLLALRRQHDTLHAGGIAEVVAEGSVLRFRRVGLEDGESTDFQVVLNLGSEVATVSCAKGTVVLTTLLDGAGSSVEGTVTVEAGEGLLIALE